MFMRVISGYRRDSEQGFTGVAEETRSLEHVVCKKSWLEKRFVINTNLFF